MKCSGDNLSNISVYIESLGCDKNRVDTEHMLGILASKGAGIAINPKDADVIIVNTCGFIEDAKRESIDAILNMAKYKNQTKKALIVTGCLVQRYAKSLEKELPEVDAFLGVCAYSRLPEAINAALCNQKYVCCERINEEISERVLTTPSHMAYVRISDGCSNRCSYCAIPMIRGKHKSRNFKTVLDEISGLRKMGVQEVVLIAQDTTRYGEDLGKILLPELISEAADIMQGGWLRVMYCYPEGITDKLIAAMLQKSSVCRYIDVPIQHFSNGVLKRMNRRHTKQSAINLVERLHESGFAVRTSLIAGFPGETLHDFDTMLECIERLRFEHLGVFCYSAEEGTAAAKMGGQIKQIEKARRKDMIMRLQADISRSICKAQIGKSVKVLIDGKEGLTYAGRTQDQAIEVDGLVLINSKKHLTQGCFHDVLIKAAKDYDLIGVT